jgi:hypothetical protein
VSGLYFPDAAVVAANTFLIFLIFGLDAYQLLNVIRLERFTHRTTKITYHQTPTF